MIKKFYGKGNVFIKANSPITLNGKTYLKGDIITYFDEVKLVLGHKVDVAEGTTNRLEVVDVNSSPMNLFVSGVKNDQRLDKIFFEEGIEANAELISIEKVERPSTVLYLKDSKSLSKVRAFSEGVEVPVVLDKENGTITLEKNYSELEILSFFSKKGVQRTLKKPEIGYVNIVAVVEGYLGENKGNFILDIPKAAMITDPSFDFSEDPEYLTDIAFLVITDRLKNTGVTITHV